MSHRLHDPKYLAGRWRLNGHGMDSSGHGGTAQLFNTPLWSTFNKGKQCILLDGDDAYANLGQATDYLDAASALTFCFWMNQDVLDVLGYIFYKVTDVDNNIVIATTAGGDLEVRIENGGDGIGAFDYSAVISANNWHHVAAVFDGSGAANIDRLVVYVDGVPMTLAFTGTVPAATADLAGEHTLIGRTANSFDGELYDMRIYTAALSRDEVNAIIHESLGVS